MALKSFSSGVDLLSFPLVSEKRRGESGGLTLTSLSPGLATGRKEFAATGGKEFGATGGKEFPATGGNEFAATGGNEFEPTGGNKFTPTGGKSSLNAAEFVNVRGSRISLPS